MIIGVTGFKRSGKDTAADIIRSLGYRKVAFADALRAMIYTLDPYVPPFNGETDREWKRYGQVLSERGYELAKENPEIRRLLQVFGTEVMRKMLDDDIWVDILEKAIVDSDWKDWVVSDVRFDNEATMVRKHGGMILRVRRAGLVVRDDHASERGVSDHLVDWTIDNDGSLDDFAAYVRNAESTLRRGV